MNGIIYKTYWNEWEMIGKWLGINFLTPCLPPLRLVTALDIRTLFSSNGGVAAKRSSLSLSSLP